MVVMLVVLLEQWLVKVVSMTWITQHRCHRVCRLQTMVMMLEIHLWKAAAAATALIVIGRLLHHDSTLVGQGVSLLPFVTTLQ